MVNNTTMYKCTNIFGLISFCTVIQNGILYEVKDNELSKITSTVYKSENEAIAQGFLEEQNANSIKIAKLQHRIDELNNNTIRYKTIHNIEDIMKTNPELFL